MNDDVYLTMARNWKDQGDGIKPLLRLLEDPGALAAGKFGSDPAGALRQGITENLSDKDLPAAISLCQEAANTPAAADYLLGLVSKYVKNFDADTMFGLLQGVPDIQRKSLILRKAASRIFPESVAQFFEHAQFPQEIREDVILGSAKMKLSAVNSGGDSAWAFFLVENGSTGEARQDMVMTLLREAEVPKPAIRANNAADEEQFFDATMERIIRLASGQEPELAKKWIGTILNPELRASLTVELSLGKP